VPDWDEDSSRLRHNLTRILEEIVRESDQRHTPSVEMARRWQRHAMQALKPQDPKYVGAFRGEPGLERTRVRIGKLWGVPPGKVAQELKRFERKLQTALAELDRELPAGREANADQLAAIIDVCAWTHAEWVRIHPFANGNGRTARIWANFIALRYGLPPFVYLRPRPDDGYGDAGERAMRGNWRPTARVFGRLLDRFLDEFGS
jgi:hypothetical protein